LADMMRAVVWQGPHRVALEHRPVPDPGPGQALVRVLYNGVCSTDYPIVRGLVEGSYPGMILGTNLWGS
jgi:threonine dehydrogenase-like Zn-dependent dehydrogenase